MYGDTFSSLTANELLAIEDAYYNGGNAVVGKPYVKEENGNIVKDLNGAPKKRNTNFFIQIKEYDKARQEGYLEKAELHFKFALCELKYQSNPNNHGGIQKRRDSEAELLNTHNYTIFETADKAKQALKVLEQKAATVKRSFRQPGILTAILVWYHLSKQQQNSNTNVSLKFKNQ